MDVATEDGEVIEYLKEYTVVTNSFLAAGGGEYVVFKQAEDIQDTFHYLRNIIVEYVKKHSPIEMHLEGRIIDVSRK